MGCIFAEMMARKPLFPGKDYLHQLRLILDFLGTPQPDSALSFVSNSKAAAWLRALPRRPRPSLAATLGGASASAVDLVDRLLVFNPASRLGVAEALRHPFLMPLSDAGAGECDWEGSAAAASAAAGELISVAPPLEPDDSLESGDEIALRMLLFAECGFGDERSGSASAVDEAGAAKVACVTAAAVVEAAEASKAA